MLYCLQTWLKDLSNSASERRTASIFRWPPLIGITTNDSWAWMMSPLRNVCGSQCWNLTLQWVKTSIVLDKFSYFIVPVLSLQVSKYWTWLSSVWTYEQVPSPVAIPRSTPWGSTPFWKATSWPSASFSGVKYRFEISRHSNPKVFSSEQVQLSKVPSRNWRLKQPYTSPAASNALVKVGVPRPVKTTRCRRYLKRWGDTLQIHYENWSV